MKRLLAFTLAETLIVMGVIGVVAALTLPNLNQSTNNKEKVTKLQKLYSNLNDAYGRATAVYGPIDEWQSASNEKLAERLLEFMKYTKYCGSDENSSCWFEKNSLKFPIASVADGTSIVFYYKGCSTENDCGELIVDLDGPRKGSHTYGKTIFRFYITKQNGVIPFGDTASNCFSDHASKCTKWVIENGNMDYLKANSSGRCTNGTQLSETVTSCN